ncbi:GNAT family N-acetyltransferase [Amycolatopsis lurida]
MPDIALRQATAADEEFCFQLHKASLGEYVAELWGWEDEVQREHHRRVFVPERWRIVTVDGTDAGVLVVEAHPEGWYLGRIELLPEYQGRGIGGVLIQRLADRGTPLHLEVLAVNRRALEFYRRHGFRETGRHAHKIHLRRDPR